MPPVAYVGAEQDTTRAVGWHLFALVEEYTARTTLGGAARCVRTDLELVGGLNTFAGNVRWGPNHPRAAPVACGALARRDRNHGGDRNQTIYVTRVRSLLSNPLKMCDSINQRLCQ